MNGSNYLDSTKKQFIYYKMLADKTIDALPPEKLGWRYNQESNSIAVIIQHMAGNMLSRFTGFLTSDGEKPWRNRDGEFEASSIDPSALLELWERGWAALKAALDELQEEDLSKIVFIRNEGHTVLEAINRQLPHYAYHIGQIVFTGKMLLDKEWVSLSISRGASKNYNKEKFVQPQQRRHYIDGILSSESNGNSVPQDGN